MAVNRQKLKLLYLMRMLEEETDAEQGLTMSQILERLEAQGITAERKGIYRDIEALREFGLDVRTYQRAPVEYALERRDFAFHELLLLVDAVQSSRFLTQRKSDALVEAVKRLASARQCALLDKRLHVEGRIKMQNESVFHHVDTLHEAIRRHRQVAFRYVKHDVNKRPQPQGGGRIYCETPVCLIYSEGCYYLIAYNEKHDSFPSYRVDRMQGLRITDDAAVRNERIATFDAATYTSRTFSMFGGETMPATLLVEESVMSAIIDRFGKDVESAPVDATHARVHVTVAASPVFFGWLAQFGTAVRLEAPSALARQYADYLRDIADSY
ncbi:helix-turn-helix transcriptional regulator [Adlercreutzia equolifaciens]|uniref:helix-turn-helix transcriptional regulator n=1 Tax=Adlercreutzia equolifaciens TaxID=446660 RepID=UPI003AF011F4